MTIRSVVGRRCAFLPLALALPWVVLAWAQAGPDKKESPERDRRAEEEGERDSDRARRILEMLNEKLDLSADQRSKVESIIADGKPQREAIRREMKALQEKVQKQMFAQTEKIRAVLSDEQKMKFDHIKGKLVHHQMQGDGAPGRKGMRDRPGPGRRFGPRDEEGDEPGEHYERPEHPDR